MGSQKSCLRMALIITLCICAYIGVNADEIKIQLFQNAILNDYLVMRFQAEDVFNEKVIKFLDRGFTIRIDYRIELWQSRTYWFDRLNSQYNISYRINFEPLEKRYECLRTQQGVASDSKLNSRRDKIIEWVTRMDKPLEIIPISHLERNSKYYYNIEILIATLTSENIKDLQKWLGELRDEKEEPSTLTKTTFKVATDFISSRNHKKASMRSEQFYLRDLPKINKETVQP